MVTFKAGDKVKIPKTKTPKTAFSDSHIKFMQELRQRRYTKDYLVVDILLGNGDIRCRTCSSYNPIFSVNDLELYNEHITHELW